MADADGYRSSDDEDYNPENDILDEQDVLDDAEDSEIVDGDHLAVEQPETSTTVPSSSSSADVDALFAELTGEDPLLAEINRRKKIEDSKFQGYSIHSDLNVGGEKSEENIEELLSQPSASEQDEETKPEAVPISSKPKKRTGTMEALQALSKKQKISVLEKSDRDWKSFKTEKKITEDLTSHNRGKNGYLNKMDFLNRTDNRQFETEREFRATARKDKL